MSTIPERPALEGLEGKWGPLWESQGTYRFDRADALARGKGEVFSVDTPPPTASGSLHIGHVFSYTHMDLVTRFQRMRGKAIFYPMGWDDNGLPTERRVQNYYGVRCDPSLPYDADFTPPLQGGEGSSGKAADQVPISRRNFIELCEELTAEDEKQFEDLWRQLGLSVDWSLTYRTIGDHAQAAAQRAFLRNLDRGEAYQADAPTLWDITFRTAVAQAELEDKEQPAAYHRVAFHRTDGEGDIHIETTRPELLAACVALVAHPDDERYKPFFGTTVTTPLFGVEVPVVAHHLAQQDKGSGIAMICTFGDVTDVVWWRELDLPNRTIIGADGRIIAEPPAAIETDAAKSVYAELAGKTVFSAKARTVELLRESGELIGDPKPITHSVKFFEKGDKPLEIISTRQWYISNGARDEALREKLVNAGKEIAFTPDHMRVRYENWVGGLTGDWLISRQRFFGVPIPVWYELDADGEKGAVIVPSEDSLPIDPSSDVPPGYTEADRGKTFAGEVDIMDTWATSSLTPQIAGGWVTDPELFDLVFPYALRSQGQDIIRTWLFSTVLRAELENGTIPWRNAGISGFIVDPDRKKMSKSKGNVVTPKGMLDDHGSDAVRYWAASSRLGTDAAFDPQNPKQIKIGRRLAIKVLNAAKFVYAFPASGNVGLDAVSEPLDRDMLAELATVVRIATDSLENFDHARALETTEQFFWTFCDDYLELVKDRAYGSGAGQESAVAALRTAIDVMLRLLAPYLPFATEEVWSWTHEGSVHTASWPTVVDLGSPAEAEGLLTLVSEALIGIRRAKTDAKASQKTEVLSATITGPAQLEDAMDDLKAVGRITDVTFVVDAEIAVTDIVLAEGARVIRPLLAEDQAAWRELFTAYGVFYETDFDDAVLEKVWMLLLTAGSGVDAIVSLDDDNAVVGFAHYRSHPDTFTGGRDWFLDDLYVSQDARGAGHASALIEHIAQLARDAGSPGSLRWITAADNERAQRVYDRVATKTTWVTYELRPGGEGLMQLGTRWNVGEQPPARLTDDVVAAVRGVEAELVGIDTTGWRWTLTWLEGRPVVELDDGTTIRVDYAGGITVEEAAE